MFGAAGPNAEEQLALDEATATSGLTLHEFGAQVRVCLGDTELRPTLVSLLQDSVAAEVRVPRELSPRVYFWPDMVFGRPKGTIRVRFEDARLSFDLPTLACHLMRGVLINDGLGSLKSAAARAGIVAEYSAMATGHHIMLCGYNHRLCAVLKQLLAHVANPPSLQDAAVFSRLQKLAARHFCNQKSGQPLKQGLVVLNRLLLKRERWSSEQYGAALSETSLGDVQQLHEALRLSSTHGTLSALVSGNFDASEAAHIGHKLQAPLQEARAGDTTVSEEGVALPPPAAVLSLDETTVVLPRPCSYRYMHHLDSRVHTNRSCIVLYELAPKSDAKQHALATVACSLLKAPFQVDLRTRQMLGYVVSSGQRTIGTNRYIHFEVQSEAHSAAYLEQSIDEFVQAYLLLTLTLPLHLPITLTLTLTL